MPTKPGEIIDEATRLFQGEATSRAFKGEGNTGAVHEIYGESAQYFANIIAGILNKDQQHYTFADFGGHKGELLQSVMNQLSDYNLETIGIDIDAHLQENSVAHTKVPANLNSIPLDSDNVNFGMMRYVLPWNTLQEQANILQEVVRVTKDFLVVQHAGADNVDSREWRTRLDELFTGIQVPKLKRSGYFFSSQNEVEEMLTENKICFRKLDSKRVESVSDVFVERFALSENEANIVRDILGNKDYIYRTTWLITKRDSEK